jgi:uncharacterized membrane protein YgaE (UPF0421/DUF939 family)
VTFEVLMPATVQVVSVVVAVPLSRLMAWLFVASSISSVVCVTVVIAVVLRMRIGCGYCSAVTEWKPEWETLTTS